MDWLSILLNMMPISGQLELRCHYSAPWRIAESSSPHGEMPYHVVLGGSAILEDPTGGPQQHLSPGDILLLPHGGAHVLHDGSGRPLAKVTNRVGLNFTISENAGTGARLDMMCGRFMLAPPHDRVLLNYLPPRLIVRTSRRDIPATSGMGAQLTDLVALMRNESGEESLGGRAMLNALSAALFTLTLRFASESDQAPAGLLALAGNPRLAPALAALFNEPAHPWTLPELARLCNMSRATLARQFQEKLGRSASDLLTDIRMTSAANQLRSSSSASVGTIAETVGYQSEAAFQRAFKQHMGTTPARWRHADDRL